MFTAEIGSFKKMSTYTNGNNALPLDYYDRVGRKGDTYRDKLTRECLYLSTMSTFGISDCIIVAVQSGNGEAIQAFEESCERGIDPGPSATHFAVATTSAAATSANIFNRAMGGNYTISAGPESVPMALLAAAAFLKRNVHSNVHFFFEEKVDLQRTETCYVRFSPRTVPDSSYDLALGRQTLETDPARERIYKCFSTLLGDLQGRSDKDAVFIFLSEVNSISVKQSGI